jgi:uncharacterized membrane protein YccC
MNLMITLMLACVAVGLLSRTLGPRQYLLVAGFATVATVLWFSSRRYM